MLLTLDIKYLNPHKDTSVLGQIMPNFLALNLTVNYRMNYLKIIVSYPWKVFGGGGSSDLEPLNCLYNTRGFYFLCLGLGIFKEPFGRTQIHPIWWILDMPCRSVDLFVVLNWFLHIDTTTYATSVV